tara:strand:+ start:784 stop:1431 length:648 start_codon:yes stop_codon:yes gene_type:complete
MSTQSEKKIINLNDNKYNDWRLCLQKKLELIQSHNIEINCEDIDLRCKDILSIIEVSNKKNCKIINFYSFSPLTIISIQALGYQSQLIDNKYLNNYISENIKKLNSPSTNFHEGTVRSGDYINSAGDLLILGDVNPGAIVSAEGNVMIWGRLLGIAHAGNKGDIRAKIAALQLRPVQLRIANKIARGPEEKPELGLAEQATIKSGSIIISPLKIF